MSNLITLTPENYYSQEANMQYVSVSQYKDFNGTTGKLGCEAYAMAKLRGEVEEVSTTPLLVGSYVDAYFEGTLPTFSAQHPEIFSSRGKTAGELKAEYKQASAMIDRAEKRQKFFMQYMAGDKQVIMTGEINGIPVKIKIDSCDGKRITDLKTVKSVTETFYAKDLGQRLNSANGGDMTSKGLFIEKYIGRTQVNCYRFIFVQLAKIRLLQEIYLIRELRLLKFHLWLWMRNWQSSKAISSRSNA